jgi:NAD+ synthase
MQAKDFSPELLTLDPTEESARIVTFIRESIAGPLRKRGAVVAVSGGVDSSTTLGLCVRALGSERVLALLLPERESDPRALDLGKAVAKQFGVRYEAIDITPLLSAAGCYGERDAAVRDVFPDFCSEHKFKISLGGYGQDRARLLYYNLTVEDPDGRRRVHRLTTQGLRRIVAATNMKQRTRKALEYFHADRLNYAVVGTANLLEHELGFFVKLGDGAADLKPIAHLYKTQVYALATFLRLPDRVLARTPSSDTYSLEQSQEEFFFDLPLQQLDLLVFGVNHGYAEVVIAGALGVSGDRMQVLLNELQQKRMATAPLHMAPLLLDPRVHH